MDKHKLKEVLNFVAFLSPSTVYKTTGESQYFDGLDRFPFVSVTEILTVGRDLKALCNNQLGSI